MNKSFCYTLINEPMKINVLSRNVVSMTMKWSSANTKLIYLSQTMHEWKSNIYVFYNNLLIFLI